MTTTKDSGDIALRNGGVVEAVEEAPPPATPSPRRKTSVWGFLIGPALFVLALLLPPPEGVPALGMRSLGIFLWIMSWWIAEPIPVPATGFLALALLVLCGVFPLETAFGYWANWVNLFLIGAFIIGEAMNRHGLNQRFAYWMVSLPFIGNSSWRLMFTLLSACALLSAITSNTVCAILFTSIALSFIHNLRIAPGSRFSTALLIGVPWAASIGGTATPVGAATQMYTLGLLRDLNYRVGFLPWMTFGFPIMVTAMAVMFLVIWAVFRPEFREIQISPLLAREELAKLGPIQRGGKISVVVLLMALIFWMLPDFAQVILRPNHPLAQMLQTRLSWSVVALLAALALFLVPVDWKQRKFAMTWADARNGIDWGVLALIAGALAIGNALSSPEVGWGKFFSRGVGVLSERGEATFLVPGSIVFIGLLTNFVSNFAALSAVVPLMLAAAASPGSGINPVALTLSLGLAASWAFALPSATPINAIAFASGSVRIFDMFKGGMILALLCTLATALWGYHFLAWIFPWPG